MQLSPDGDKLLSQVKSALPDIQGKIGVAVSGGGDSLALMYLLADLCEQADVELEVVTVDHGLRTDSAIEAKQVFEMCRAAGLQHATARWTGWTGNGNLQDSARAARYRLIAEWAKRREVAFVCLGHTQDDVAETFVMRLARQSGVDGLSIMADVFEREGVEFRRPLLNTSRKDLRKFLRQRDIGWIDDPSNDNEDFQRVRVRKSLDALEAQGITAQVLANVALNMRVARDALQLQTHKVAKAGVTEQTGDLLIDRDVFLGAPEEIQRRILQSAVRWVSGGYYVPRRNGVVELIAAISAGRNFALGGCLATVRKTQIRMSREYRAVRTLVEFSPSWDRWSLDGPWQVGMRVAALGEPGLSELENWRDSVLPRKSLMSSPAVWKDEQLIAAPVAVPDKAWKATQKGLSFIQSLTAEG